VDREYNLRYKADNTEAVASTNGFVSALRGLDQLADRLIAKLRTIFQGYGKGAQEAAAANGTVNNTFQTLQVQVNQTATAVQQFNTTIRNSVQAPRDLTASFLGMHAAMAGLGAVRQAIDGLGDGLEKARDYAKETAEENLKLLDSLRELAALRGKAAPDASDSAQAVGLMLDAGFKNPQEARQFQQFFEGAIEVAEGKGNLSPAQGTPEELKRQMTRSAARLAVAKGVDPQTAAKLAASVATTHEVTDVAQVEAELGLMVRNLAAAPDEVSPLAKQVLQTRGSLIQMGFADSLPDVASLVSAVDVNNSAGRSGNRLESMANEITKVVGDPEKGKELAKIGITPQNRNLGNIIGILKGEIDEANKPGGIGGVARLRQLGLTNSRAMTEFVKISGELPFLQGQLANNKAVMSDPAKVRAEAGKLRGQLDQFDQSTVGRNRAGDAALQASRFLRGQQQQNVEVAAKAAEAQLAADHKIDTPATNATDAILDVLTPVSRMIQGGNAREHRVNEQIVKNLITAGNAVGIDVQSQVPDIHLKGRYALGSVLNQFVPMIKARGGNPFGDTSAIKDKADAIGAGAPAAGGPRADAGHNAQLDTLIQETRRTNQILASRGAPPAIPDAGGGAMPGRS
jgi:hypothetical protein